MKKPLLPGTLSLLSLALGFTSCTPAQQQWGAGGALAGGAAGALFGNDGGDVVRGAALGAAAGAGAAAYQEHRTGQSSYPAYRQPTPSYPQQPAQPTVQANDRIPMPGYTYRGYRVANPTGETGIVRSPYPPYRKVNVAGLSSGQKARDPISQDIFIVP